jgi:hypothetical protein
VALLDFWPLNVSAVLNILTVVFALALGWIVLRLLLRVTRLVFTVGCLGIVAIAVVLAVSAFVRNG